MPPNQATVLRLENIGADRYGYILTSPPIVHMTHRERQTIVGPGANGFETFFEFESFDQAAPDRCPRKSCWSFRTEMEFVESIAPFFDLKLRTRGSKLVKCDATNFGAAKPRRVFGKGCMIELIVKSDAL